MYILLFFINFILLNVIFFLSNKLPNLTNLRLSFVKALISIAFLTYIITEFLSFFKGIVFINFLGAWAIVLVGALFCLIYLLQKYKYKQILCFDCYEKDYILLIVACVVLIILPLLFLAIFYPPCNSDSLCYHLPRIEHWIQNKSVAHYFTNEIRQLYTPPLSEFIQLQIGVLSGTDFWFNLVQFFAMLGSLFLVSLIIQILGLGYKYQILGGLLTLFIPMGILQAITTQTDYVATFFLCAFVYFGFRLIKLDKIYWTDVLWGSMALALGFFTKQTVVVFAFPFALWFAILLFKRNWKSACGIGFTGLFFMILINLPFATRNYLSCGSFWGPKPMVQMMQNKKMNVRFFTSNLIRNISMHMAFPFANRVFNKGVIKFHEKILKVNPEDPATTFCSQPYEPFFCINEDSSGNFFFVFVLLFALFYTVFKFKNLLSNKQYTMLCYFCSLVGGYSLFTYIFKWQPWITRLDLPWFVISIPFIVYVLKRIFSAKSFSRKLFLYFIGFLSCYWMGSFAVKNLWLLLVSLVLTMIIYFIATKSIFRKNFILGSFISSAFLFSFPYVYFNAGKPLLCRCDKLFASREFKYFAVNKAEYDKHIFIASVIKKYKIKYIYIMSPVNEYRLWVILRDRIEVMPKIRHLNVFQKENFGEASSEYFAIVSYVKNGLNHIPSDMIIYSRSLGTERDPLSIIILKNKT